MIDAVKLEGIFLALNQRRAGFFLNHPDFLGEGADTFAPTIRDI
jgi:hypothetical protein